MEYKVGYARVSTKDQNLEVQKQELRKAGCQKIFTDKGTGANMKRAGLQEALNYLRKGDQLVVIRMDRLARNLRDLISIMDVIVQKGATLHSLSEADLSFDNSPQGTLILQIVGAVAQFELSLIQSRTKEAQKVAKENGTKFGRPPKLTPKETEAVRERVSNGMITMMEASKKYGVSRTTISRIMKRQNT